MRGFVVNVCGVRSAAVARTALEAGADRLGLVFAPSPRRIDPDEAEALVRTVPSAWVGVFVDAPDETMMRRAEALDLAALQLHGTESPETCLRLRETTGRPVWKALPWTGDPGPLAEYAEAVDAILLDAEGGKRRGGTGRTLPWDDIAAHLAPDRRAAPLILAGGLDGGNVARAIAACRPDGVDASSRLERTAGEKDPDRVRAFVDAARRAARGAAVS